MLLCTAIGIPSPSMCTTLQGLSGARGSVRPPVQEPVGMEDSVLLPSHSHSHSHLLLFQQIKFCFQRRLEIRAQPEKDWGLVVKNHCIRAPTPFFFLLEYKLGFELVICFPQKKQKKNKNHQDSCHYMWPCSQLKLLSFICPSIPSRSC